MRYVLHGGLIVACVAACLGCATTKESDTARTGIEQLLVSSAVDGALDRIDFTPVRGAKIYLEEKYLDCVDKNYVIVSLEERLLSAGSTLVAKPEEADVIMHVTSGGVGTDRQEKYVGISEIPLPPPSPISIPQVSLLSRQRANGTAKLRIVAFDAKSRRPVLAGGAALARSDFKSWKVLGAGPVESGSVPTALAKAERPTVDGDFVPANIAAAPAAPAPSYVAAMPPQMAPAPASIAAGPGQVFPAPPEAPQANPAAPAGEVAGPAVAAP